MGMEVKRSELLKERSDNQVVIPLSANGYVEPFEEVNGNGEISADGLGSWSSTESVTKTYFLLNNTGALRIALVAKGNESDSVIRVSIDGQSFDVNIGPSNAYDLVDVGTVFISQTGYYHVDVRGISRTGAYFPAIQAVVISGEAARYAKHNASVYRSAPSTHLFYPIPEGKSAEWFYSEISVPEGADPLHAYYMANGFRGGYFGIQVNSKAERRVLFSVWSAYETDDPSEIPSDYKVQLIKKGTDVVTNDFGNEGSGGQSFWRFDWKTETVYKFLLHAEPSGDSTLYSAYFFAPEIGEWKFIAQWNKLKSGGNYFEGLYSFVENFADNGDELFKARYGNQWIRTNTGKWIELTQAKYGTTADEQKHPRFDHGAGIEQNWFYMYSGGFREVGSSQKGDVLTRPVNANIPDLGGITMRMPFIEELERDLNSLYEGLDGIATYAESGGVTAIGERAFPVAIGRTTPVITAARYGEGRIAAAGHEAYFDPAYSNAGNPGTFVRNMINWLTNGTGGPGVEPARIESWTEEQPDPTRYPLVMIDASIGDADLPYADAYIRSGGAVIVALKGWELEENSSAPRYPLKIREYPLQRLLNKAGLGLLGDVSVWSAGAPLPKPTVEKVAYANAAYLLNQAKAVEAGELMLEQLPIGPPQATDKQKTEAVMTILSRTIEALTDDSPLNGLIREDAARLADVGLPLDRTNMPYTGALFVQRFKQTTLAPDNVRSPYADLFPGKVDADAPAVPAKDVQVNFEYADLGYLRTLSAPETWQSTGLYAPAGQTVELAVPEGVEHLDVQIGSHTDTLYHLAKWDRAPQIAFRQKLAQGANKLCSPYGGLIYLIPTRPKAGASTTVTISGAVQAPYFVSGQTTEEEWNESLRNSPAPVAELQGKRMILTVPSDVVRSLSYPQELMDNWDEMADKYDEFIGLAPDKPLPHRSPDRPHRIVSDKQISAGYMHSGYPIMIPIEPAGWDAVDFDKVRNVNSAWGFWHELGHNYQQVPWFWDMIVEVTVNLHSLHMQDFYGNRSRLFTTNKEGRTHYDIAFDFVDSEETGKHYEQLGFFERLVMIRQLQLAYGWEFYTRLHIAYRELPEEKLPRTDQQKLDCLVVMMCKVSGEDLTVFFEKWGWSFTEEARQEVAALGLPKPKTDIWKLKEADAMNN